MTTLLSDCWSHLEPAVPAGDKLIARVALPEVSPRLYCGIDGNGKRHLLIRLGEEENNYSDSRSRGLSVKTHSLSVHDQGSGRYIDIECIDTSGQLIFDVLAIDLASRMAKPEADPAESVRHTIAKWRRFWGHTPLSLLTREKQLGRFAELWFLNFWLLTNIDGDEAIARWRGPTGSRHDFAWSHKAVEVKATTSPRGRLYKVNGLDQLVPPENGELLFFGMNVQEDTGATNCLPAIVARSREKLANNADALARFETLLALAGYLNAHEQEYEKLTVAVREETLFQVRDDFPRLVPKDLPKESFPGVERVEYDINLNGFDHLLISDKQLQRDVLT
ncbi:MAG: PD-(D/E)XK motif protein, partial [Pirellulales bacterium]|nr:PD-(D/E)XK motif protein [Pirellulales bacterium]